LVDSDDFFTNALEDGADTRHKPLWSDKNKLTQSDWIGLMKTEQEGGGSFSLLEVVPHRVLFNSLFKSEVGDEVR